MEHFHISRDGDVPLEFNGEWIASQSSWAEGKDRWFEIDIYRAESGAWIVAGVGATSVPDEEERTWAVVCFSAEDVVKSLVRKSDEGVTFIPKTSQRALAQAAERDSEIAKVYVQRV